MPAAGGPITWFQVPGDPRNNYLARMEWAASSDEVVIQHLNRLQNTNTVYLGDRRTGAVRHGAGGARQRLGGCGGRGHAGSMAGRASCGRASATAGATSTGSPGTAIDVTLLTPGEFDIAGVAAVDEAGGWLYYIACPDNPAQRYLYRARLDGSGRAERVSPGGSGRALTATTSRPTRGWRFHTYSRFGVPPVTELVRAARTPVSAHPRGQCSAQGAGGRRCSRGPAEFFQVDIGDGVKLNGWIMKPVDFNPNRRYPLFFTNYGGPGSQTVLDSWGGSNYLWNLLLTQKGYLVASVDNRGTGMRGRDWRKIVYRRLGVIETQDQANAARAIGRWSYVDSTRIGVFGWSYGGFMSLNGLFQAPDVYRMAIAVAPVTHWKFYDNIYTERYNGLPQENEDGYDKGSPLSYVDQLRGRLLLVHGTGDDNVHYQNSESLLNKLVAANKQFEFMSYPNRNHGISGGNTALHLRELLTRFIDETLGPPVARPNTTAGPLTN